jgi:secreted trypsin-like serine protease
MMQSDTYPSFWYLVGVTSFGKSQALEILVNLNDFQSSGPARCGSSTPGIYTKVEHFVTWIESKIKL